MGVGKRNRRNKAKIKAKEKRLNVNVHDLPNAPPKMDDDIFNDAMDNIRNFELKQMSYKINYCIVCKERRIEMTMSSELDTCKRCYTEKNSIKIL